MRLFPANVLLKLLPVLSVFWAMPSFACAVCFDSKGENRWAFIGTTALMTFLPLAVLGGTVWWLRQRVLEAAAEEDSCALLDEPIA